MRLGYARVSTSDQTTDPQEMRLRSSGCDKVYRDIISGRYWERPGLSELLAFARPGDVLVIVRLDRLGRSLRELLTVVDDLRARGVALASLEEAIDTSTATGELMMHVFGALAQFERTLISERTRDGLAAARQRGRTVGRPPLRPEMVDAARKIIEGGGHIVEAARSLKCGVSTLYRYLKGCDHEDTNISAPVVQGAGSGEPYRLEQQSDTAQV